MAAVAPVCSVANGEGTELSSPSSSSYAPKTRGSGDRGAIGDGAAGERAGDCKAGDLIAGDVTTTGGKSPLLPPTLLLIRRRWMDASSELRRL